METTKHRDQMNLLINSLRAAWKDRADYHVDGNSFFYFSETQARNNDFRGPDVFVVLDTNARRRRSWVVWEEDGKRPDVIIELTSDSTRAVDHGKKKQIYAMLGIPEYFIFDPEDGALEGFGLDALTKKYVPMEPDARGLLRSHRLGLWLGVKVERYVYDRAGDEGPWLRWLDDAGCVLPLADEVVGSEQARAAEAEHQRREAEHQRREAEQQRAAAEHERREAERRARELAEKLEEYERRFGRIA